jgi:hypothetical protein
MSSNVFRPLRSRCIPDGTVAKEDWEHSARAQCGFAAATVSCTALV